MSEEQKQCTEHSCQGCQAHQQDEDTTSQRAQEPNTDDFDTTSMARLKALENAAVKLSEALREVSEYSAEEGNPTLHLKKTLVTQNIAVRNIRQCLEDLNNLITALLNDLVMMVQALAHTEESQVRLATHLDTLQATLIEAGLVTQEQIQKTFQEKVLPQLIARANEGAAARAKRQAETPNLPTMIKDPE